MTNLPFDTRYTPPLAPWKAFASCIAMLGLAMLAYREKLFFAACGFSGAAGMWLQDWAQRLKDKYGGLFVGPESGR